MQLLAFLDPEFLWIVLRVLWPVVFLFFALGFFLGYRFHRRRIDRRWRVM